VTIDGPITKEGAGAYKLVQQQAIESLRRYLEVEAALATARRAPAAPAAVMAPVATINRNDCLPSIGTDCSTPTTWLVRTVEMFINWNDWSPSIGIAGRHQPVRAEMVDDYLARQGIDAAIIEISLMSRSGMKAADRAEHEQRSQRADGGHRHRRKGRE
jgi:hypothetical protein